MILTPEITKPSAADGLSVEVASSIAAGVEGSKEPIWTPKQQENKPVTVTGLYCLRCKKKILFPHNNNLCFDCYSLIVSQRFRKQQASKRFQTAQQMRWK